MMRTVLLGLSLVFVFSGLAFAQTKTVTNADLEKFKQKRLKAEKELRENYAEMGFPSPEELNEQKDESAKELSAYSNRLRQERLTREADRNVSYSGSRVRYSDSDTPADFIDYQQYYGATYYYRNYRQNSYFRNNRNVRNRRYRSNNSGFKVRGFFGSRANSRKRTTFGPSRRLTRQNRIKSRRSDIRKFGFGVSIGTKRN